MPSPIRKRARVGATRLAKLDSATEAFIRDQYAQSWTWWALESDLKHPELAKAARRENRALVAWRSGGAALVAELGERKARALSCWIAFGDPRNL